LELELELGLGLESKAAQIQEMGSKSGKVR
jgi:hypothetical protein